MSAALFNLLVALGEYEMAGMVLVEIYKQQADARMIVPPEEVEEDIFVPEEVEEDEDPTN